MVNTINENKTNMYVTPDLLNLYIIKYVQNQWQREHFVGFYMNVRSSPSKVKFSLLDKIVLSTHVYVV